MPLTELLVDRENKSAQIAWVDNHIKRFLDLGMLIPETQRAIYKRIGERWGLGKSIVDVGCCIGVGTNILTWYARIVWGIDINQEAIRFAESSFERPGLSFKVLDIENSRRSILPTFDIIVAVELLEHLADYQAGLDTIKRLFHAGGNSVGFITIPNIDREDVRMRDAANPLHLNRWSVKEFRQLMATNFQSVRLFQTDELGLWSTIGEMAGVVVIAEVGDPG